MEAASRAAYLDVKNSRRVGRRYLYLMRKLAPLRIACAGGHVPLADGVLDRDGKVDPDTGEQSEDKVAVADDNDAGKKINKKVLTFSKFAFTSKLEALISELENIREKDETGMSYFTCSSFVRDFDILIIFFAAKCIVFSQFSSTLNWLQDELPRRGFQFRTLSGSMTLSKRAAALRDFQNDPPTTLFLLSMRYVRRCHSIFTVCFSYTNLGFFDLVLEL